MSKIAGKNVVVGVCGGIAAYKACELVRALVKKDADVWVVMTQNAQKFVSPLTFETLSTHPVPEGAFDKSWESQIGHIALADNADLIVIAPATANVIAKAAYGHADGLLTTVLLATKSPVLFCPAMNVNMYSHPAVGDNLARLKELGYGIVEPGAGELACGWEGLGRLEEPGVIVEHIEKAMSPKDLCEERMLVTAGATREFIDAARFISNPSTGKMGIAVAKEAWVRGAEVVLVSGHTEVPPPAGVTNIETESVEEMYEAVMANIDWATVVVKAAAVSDYRPTETISGKAPRKVQKKIKKAKGPISLKLERTQDILKAVGERKNGKIIVGFAAESDDIIKHASEKLIEKKADLIVANDITKPGAGFGSDTNAVYFLDRRGGVEELPLMTKTEVAEKIIDKIVELRTIS